MHAHKLLVFEDRITRLQSTLTEALPRSGFILRSLERVSEKREFFNGCLENVGRFRKIMARIRSP